MERFISNQRLKGNFEYTKKIVTPLIADKKEYKKYSIEEITSKLTEDYDYTLDIYSLRNNTAYYSLEISLDPSF